MKKLLGTIASLFLASSVYASGIFNPGTSNGASLGSNNTFTGVNTFSSMTVNGIFTNNYVADGTGISQLFIPGMTQNYSISVTSNAYLSAFVGSCVNSGTDLPVQTNGIVGHSPCYFFTASDQPTSKTIMHVLEGRGAWKGSASNYSSILFNPTHASVNNSSTTLMMEEGRIEMYGSNGTTPSVSSDTFVGYMQYPVIGTPQTGEGWSMILDSTYPVAIAGSVVLDASLPTYAPHSQITTWPSIPAQLFTIHGRSTGSGEVGVYSDAIGAFDAVEMGRTAADVILSVPASANQFMLKDRAGDLDIQQMNVGGAVNIGVGGIGTGNANIQVYGSSTIINGSGNNYVLGIGTTSSTGPFAIAVSSTNHITFGVFTSSPSVISCGLGPSLSGGASDASGVITTGSTGVTGCTLVFNQLFKNAPVCVANSNLTADVVEIYSVSTSSVTFGVSAAITAGKVYYHCFGDND